MRFLLDMLDDFPSFLKLQRGTRGFPSHEDPTYDGAIRQGLFCCRTQVFHASRVAVYHSLLSQLSFQLLLAIQDLHEDIGINGYLTIV